jgi:hypothetical protein
VPIPSGYQYGNIRMFLGLPDPDPIVRGTDPRIQIRTKISWIPNIAYNVDFVPGSPLPYMFRWWLYSAKLFGMICI